LLGYRQSIINLDTKIANRALDLGMAKEQLDGPQIAGAAIDHGGLGPPQGMRAEQARIETDAAYPVANKPRILPGREAPVSAPITLIYPDSAFRLYVGFWAQSRHPNALSRCPLSGE
jgi:hypothetical protein